MKAVRRGHGILDSGVGDVSIIRTKEANVAGLNHDWAGVICYTTLGCSCHRRRVGRVGEQPTIGIAVVAIAGVLVAVPTLLINHRNEALVAGKESLSGREGDCRGEISSKHLRHQRGRIVISHSLGKHNVEP